MNDHMLRQMDSSARCDRSRDASPVRRSTETFDRVFEPAVTADDESKRGATYEMAVVDIADGRYAAALEDLSRPLSATEADPAEPARRRMDRRGDCH